MGCWSMVELLLETASTIELSEKPTDKDRSPETLVIYETTEDALTEIRVRDESDENFVGVDIDEVWMVNPDTGRKFNMFVRMRLTIDQVSELFDFLGYVMARCGRSRRL